MGALHETYMYFCKHPNQNTSGINVQRNEQHILYLMHFSHTHYSFQGSSAKESGFPRTVNVQPSFLNLCIRKSPLVF